MFMRITAKMKSVSSIAKTVLSIYETFMTGSESGEYKTLRELPTLMYKLGASLFGFIILAVKKDQPIAPKE